MQFVDILRQHRIEFASEGRYSRPGWIQFRCPFCKEGRDPNKLYAGFNLAFGYVNCWRCGKHSVEQTLTKLCGIRWTEAKEIAGEIDKTFRPPPEQERGELIIPKGVKDLLPAHRRYLKGRGYDPDYLARQWGVRGIGIASRMAWRLFIPIHYRSRCVSWTTRTIGSSELRYISAKPTEEELDHRTLLYGEDFVRHACIVHEGPPDVWRTGPGSVCTFGVGYTEAQVRRLSRFPIRAICFDNEPEAQKRARKLCDELESFDGETDLVTLDAKDAGEAKEKEIRQLRRYYFGRSGLPSSDS